MERTLAYKNTHISYTLRRNRRARRLRITVRDDGHCLITLPPRADAWEARRFLKEKASWVIAKRRECRQLRKMPQLVRSREGYERLRDDAQRYIEARLAALNEYYGFSYNRISVRNHRSQWGSCSSKKNLNFNYKILFLPPRLADYVIVHELCHLRELNHSERFWRLVGKAVPSYSRRAQELRRYSTA